MRQEYLKSIPQTHPSCALHPNTSFEEHNCLLDLCENVCHVFWGTENRGRRLAKVKANGFIQILKKWAKWEKETVERIRDRGGSTELFAREYKNPVVTIDHRLSHTHTLIGPLAPQDLNKITPRKVSASPRVAQEWQADPEHRLSAAQCSTERLLCLLPSSLYRINEEL